MFHSISKEEWINRHAGSSMTTPLAKAGKFLTTFSCMARERNNDAETMACKRLISIFGGLMVISTAVGKRVWTYETSLVLTSESVAIRIGKNMLGVATRRRKFQLKFGADCEEKDLLRALAAVRSGIAHDDEIRESQHLDLSLESGTGYLNSLVDGCSVRFEEKWLDTGRQLNLYTQMFVPENVEKPRALLALVPGFGDTGSTPWSATCLRKNMLRVGLSLGFACLSFDHHGHGRSDGLPMFLSDFDGELVEDAANVVNETKLLLEKEFDAELPTFLSGESMGGNIVMRMSLLHPTRYKGMILAAPMTAIGEKVKPPSYQVPLLRAASWLFPKAAIIPNKILAEGFKYPEDMERVLCSPLSNPVDGIRLSTAEQCLRACETLQKEDITLPMFLFHGTADRVIPIEDSKTLFETVQSVDKEFKTYDDLCHCVNSDDPKIMKIVYEDVKQWIQKRIEKEINGTE